MNRVVEQRPPVVGPRRYRMPAIEPIVLSNGLPLWLVDTPGRALGALAFAAATGVADERAEQDGVMTLVAHLLNEGTTTRSAVEVIADLERLGARFEANATWDGLLVETDLPIARLDDVFAPIADMVFTPSFDDDAVNRVRNENLTFAIEADSDPTERGIRALLGAIYHRSSPYGRPEYGTPECIGGLDRDAVIAMHAGALLPSASTLVVVGDRTKINLDRIETTFGAFAPTPGANAAGPVDDRPNPGRSAGVTVIHRGGAPQANILVGHVGAERRDPQHYALLVVTAVLGGLFGSRLNLNLRERHGYTYGSRCQMFRRRGAGPFYAEAAVETSVTVAALREMHAEIRGIRTNPPTDAELTSARDFLAGVFPLRTESAKGLAGKVMDHVVYRVPLDELRTFQEHIANVDRDAAAAAAQRFDADLASTVIVGDADEIVADLEAAGFGPVSVTVDD
jgi:zinc protease